MSKTLCFVSRIEGAAGPASFQTRLSADLQRRGIEVGFDLENPNCDAAMVIGGTRRMSALARRKRRGALIVQRLNGINWIHRKVTTGLRHYLRAELNNMLMRFVRSRLADVVVYQSWFVKDWWEREFGQTPCPSWVIYNGVPLEQFSPVGSEKPPDDRWIILVVEGNFAGGYEIGLVWATDLVRQVAAGRSQPVELAVAGNVAANKRTHLETISGVKIRWLGQRPAEDIPKFDRKSHVLFAADLHPACPNAVLEAMACGLPIVSFNTGALPELVQEDSGRIVDYGGDPWKLDPPDIAALATDTMKVLDDQVRFRAAARDRAERHFGLEQMVDKYLDLLGWNRYGLD